MFDKTQVKIGTVLKKRNGTIGTVISYSGYYPLNANSNFVLAVKENGKHELFHVPKSSKTTIVIPEINLITL